MLPSEPPALSSRDFDPSTMPLEGEDVDMEDEQLEEASMVELSSVEINILVYLYLLESNLPHTAFSLLSESNLPSTSLFQHFHPSYPTSSNFSRGKSATNSNSNTGAGTGANGANGAPNSSGKSPTTPVFGRLNGRIEKGELVRKLWKGLRWEEVERHVNSNGEQYKPQCPSPFRLLIPHSCPSHYPSAAHNPPQPLPAALRTSSPPPRRGEAFPPPSDSEAGPSRRRRVNGGGDDAHEGEAAVGSGSGKGKRRPRRASTEEQEVIDDVDLASTRRSTSPRSVSVSVSASVSNNKRDKDRDGKRPRASDGDGDKRKRTKDRDRDRDRDGESDKLSVNFGPGAGTGAGASEPGSREDSPALKRKRGGAANATTSGSLAPPSSIPGSARRSKSPAGAGAGSNLDQVNGDSASASASTPKPTSNAAPTPRKGGRSAAAATVKNEPPPPPSRADGRPLWIPDTDISVFTEHRDSITCLAWNPKNPSILATGSNDSTARIWEFGSPSGIDTEGGTGAGAGEGALELSKKPTLLKHTSVETTRRGITSLAWHPDGSMLATGCQDGVGRLFTPDGHLQGIMTYGHGPINAIKFNPSGRLMLTPKNDFTVCLWSLGRHMNQSMKCCYDAHTKEVNDVDWLDDEVFASGGNDHIIHVFRAGSAGSGDKKPHFTFRGHEDDVTKIKWSPHPAPLTSGSGDGITGHDQNPNVPPTPATTARRLLASVSDDGYLMIWKLPHYPVDRRTGSRSASPMKSAGTIGGSGAGAGSGGSAGAGVGAGSGASAPASSSTGGSKTSYLDIWPNTSPKIRSSNAFDGQPDIDPVAAGGSGGGRSGDASGTGSGSGASAGAGAGVGGASTAGTGTGTGVPGSKAGAGAGPGGSTKTKKKKMPENCIARMCVVEEENLRMSTLEWAPALGGNGEMIVAAGAQDSTVKLFNALTGELLFALPGLEGGTSAFTFSPLRDPYAALAKEAEDEKKQKRKQLIAAGGWQGQAFVWDVASGEKVGEWEVDPANMGKGGPAMLNMTWRDDGEQLAIGMQSRSVVLASMGGVRKRLEG